MKLIPIILFYISTSAFLSGQDPVGLDAIFDPDQKVKQLATGLKFTEGPVWLPSKKTLVFSDIPNSMLMQWNQAEGLKPFRKSANSNGNLLDLEGRLLTCQHSGRNVIRSKKDGSFEVLAEKWNNQRLNSPNDLAIHSDGSIWFTDPSYGLGKKPGEIDGRNVYRRDGKTGEITKVYGGFDMPNGIVFSPDEKHLYISDTGKIGQIRAFKTPASGPLGDPVWSIDLRSDGMCVDENGHIYTTSKGGVHVLSSGGEKVGIIPCPEQPANAAFGGDDFKTLFITARTSLYSVTLKIRGSKPPNAQW